jgi:hypothetical protein
MTDLPDFAAHSELTSAELNAVVHAVNADTAAIAADLPEAGGTVTGVVTFQMPTTTGTDSPIINAHRNTTHTGGTPGYVVSTLSVASQIGAGVTNFEWPITATMDNYSTAGNNVTGYLQAHKYGTGPTWASVLEATDKTDSPSSTGGALIGVEIDCTAAGLDDFGNGIRVNSDLVCTFNAGGTHSSAEIGFGSRLSIGDNTQVRRGYAITGTINQAGFDTSLATFGARGGVNAAAYRLAMGQFIDFSGASTHVLSVNPAGGVLQYVHGGATVLSLTQGGDISLAGQSSATQFNTSAGPTWTAGSGAPTANQPKGSVYTRTDGAVGSTLYISQGGGTWNATAGV